MIRTTLIPSGSNIVLEVPQNYIGKKVEIILFTVEEATVTTSDGPLTHLASEKALAKDWLTPQEDDAWQHL